ncbi:MAG: ATP-binding cassette domain-containing protein, partial [Mycoplasmatota bacterium]
MLELKKIKKTYTTNDFKQTALNEVSLKFRKNEFVSILGPSGSGKTTLLNIIGGLDRYDSGNLIINNSETKDFKDQDWDSYRNNCVGFIFQSYNLISHISVLQNVELGMTLSGISKSKREKKALKVLDKVGLKDHAYKKPHQLSGGQMQRVAIARALANDPEIILADEPTGALDSKTSVQIMELIKEIAKDKLVIMVTHNPDLANEYSNRVVEMRDGEIINDTNPVTKDKEKDKYKIKKTAMTFLTALGLSFNNIKTKKGRTLLTAFASSIGIIGIALILSLSNGFDIQIDEFERSTLSSLPIMIMEQSMSMEDISAFKDSDLESFPDEEVVYPQDTIIESIVHVNDINDEYIDYIESTDSELLNGVSYTSYTSLNLIYHNETYQNVTSNSITVMPFMFDGSTSGFITDNFEVLSGNLPNNMNEIVLVLDNTNSVSADLLEILGLETDTEIDFEDIIGTTFKSVPNDLYYMQLGNFFIPNQDLSSIYDNEENITLEVVGIIRGVEGSESLTNTSSIIYTNELVEYFIETNKESAIVTAQLTADYNVLGGGSFDEMTTKDLMLSYLGENSTPFMIQLFPRDFDTKDELIEYLDAYNEGKDDEEQVVYTDMASMISSMSSNIMDAITIVLIAFSAISLVVSSIMIGIITYISVLERTKEIGVLRSLGARKKDITRVFNAETLIIGFTSGALGLIITRLIIFPVNVIIYNLTDLKNVAVLDPIHALCLLAISMILTVLGGFIPAKMA